MTMSDSCRNTTQQIDHSTYIDICRRVAEKFVEEIISKATIEVSTSKMTDKHKKVLQRLPTIQFDLVGPRSPTPEEETFPWIAAATSPVREKEEGEVNGDSNYENQSQVSREMTVIHEEDSVAVQQSKSSSSRSKESPKKVEVKKKRNVRMSFKDEDDEMKEEKEPQKKEKELVTIKQNKKEPSDEELRKLASRHVEEIIVKATELAAQRSKYNTNTTKEETQHIQTSQPKSVRYEMPEDENPRIRSTSRNPEWDQFTRRVRQMFIHVLRSTCLCRPESPEPDPAYL